MSLDDVKVNLRLAEPLQSLEFVFKRDVTIDAIKTAILDVFCPPLPLHLTLDKP